MALLSERFDDPVEFCSDACRVNAIRSLIRLRRDLFFISNLRRINLGSLN